MAETPPLIPAPTNPDEWPAWRETLASLKSEHSTPELARAYDKPEFGWIRSCLVCSLAMLFDRELYDEKTDSFKVDAYVERFQRDFGKLDAIVLWQAYPRIGFDSRNQFDHYRLAPGLKQAID